jgi:hypothetical protein
LVNFEPFPPLLGTWELLSFWWRTLPDGGVTKPWGAHPVGRITYDANGHVTALLMHELRNEADGLSSPPGIEAEFSAYFGTYTVDPEQKVVVHQVAASLSKAHASGEIRRNYELNEDALTLNFTRAWQGVPTTYSLEWKRISTPG